MVWLSKYMITPGIQIPRKERKILIKEGSGEEDSLTLVAGIGSSLNLILLSMKDF